MTWADFVVERRRDKPVLVAPDMEDKLSLTRPDGRDRGGAVFPDWKSGEGHLDILSSEIGKGGLELDANLVDIATQGFELRDTEVNVCNVNTIRLTD